MYSQKWYCVSLFFPKPNHDVLSPNFPSHLSVNDFCIWEYIYRIFGTVCCHGLIVCIMAVGSLHESLIFYLKNTLQFKNMEMGTINVVERVVSIVAGFLLKRRGLEPHNIKRRTTLQRKSHLCTSFSGNFYKSLRDTWMWKLRLWQRNSFSGNICLEFSVLFLSLLCSVYFRPRGIWPRFQEAI